MVVALFALSLVLIVGGVAAVIQGFPFVRLESGLAMVIGGTTAASAGTVLLGLSAAVLQMRRSTQTLIDMFGSLPDHTVGGQSAYSDAHFEEAAAGPTFVEAPAAALAAAVAPLAATKTNPGLPESGDAATEIEPPLPGSSAETPPITVAPRQEAPASPTTAESDLFGDGEPALRDGGTGPETLALRPALDEPPGIDQPSIGEPVAQPHDSEPHVVGTYASGGNTYVMFSNGTIEAETPRGRFTFTSLDELKEFVDTGGENTRGAA